MSATWPGHHPVPTISASEIAGRIFIGVLLLSQLCWSLRNVASCPVTARVGGPSCRITTGSEKTVYLA